MSTPEYSSSGQTNMKPYAQGRRLPSSFQERENVTLPMATRTGVAEDKNRLQRYVQKASMSLPVYQTFVQGEPHAPRFSCQVWVDDTCFVSSNAFPSKKMAEQDAAKHALIGILEKVKNEVPHLLEDTVFCKSILNEYAVKMNMKPPIYTTNETGTILPMFISTVVLNAATYMGQQGKNKKEASQLAARSAILSILSSESSGTMSAIVRSKFTLYDKLKGAKDLPGVPHNGTIPTGIKLEEEVQDLSGNEQNQVHLHQGDSEIPLSSSLASVGSEGDVQNILPESIVGGPSDMAPQNGHLHVFKKPKAGEASISEFAPPVEFLAAISPAPVLPYIEFVPQISEHSPTCFTSGQKQNRKKRNKAKRKEQNQPVLAAAANPQSLGSTCAAPQ